jgi:hypothetical protein
MLHAEIRLSTLILATIALFDLVTSLYMINVQGFEEGNPLFAALLAHSPLTFSLTKVLFLAGPIVVFEFVRMRNSRLAEHGTWIAAWAYFLIYSGHILNSWNIQ